MSDAGTYARLPFAEAFNVLARELEGFLNTIIDGGPTIRLEREGDNTLVMSSARPDLPMIRTPDPQAAERFARAFVAKTPGASLDEDSVRLFSVRVDEPPSNVFPLWRDAS